MLFCNNDARSLSQTEPCFCHFPAHTQFATKQACAGIELKSKVPFVQFDLNPLSKLYPWCLYLTIAEKIENTALGPFLPSFPAVIYDAGLSCVPAPARRLTVRNMHAGQCNDIMLIKRSPPQFFPLLYIFLL